MDVRRNYNNYNTSFQAITVTEGANKYFNKHYTKNWWQKFNKLVESQKDNPNKICISLEKFYPSTESVFNYYTRPCFPCDYIKITAGDKTFDNLRVYHSTLGQLKKAIKYLSKNTKDKRFIQY